MTAVDLDPFDVPAAMDDRPWEVNALCSQTDPEQFYPEKGGSTREAKAVCLRCEVRMECLEWALSNPGALRNLGRPQRARTPETGDRLVTSELVGISAPPKIRDLVKTEDLRFRRIWRRLDVKGHVAENVQRLGDHLQFEVFLLGDVGGLDGRLIFSALTQELDGAAENDGGRTGWLNVFWLVGHALHSLRISSIGQLEPATYSVCGGVTRHRRGSYSYCSPRSPDRRTAPHSRANPRGRRTCAPQTEPPQKSAAALQPTT